MKIVHLTWSTRGRKTAFLSEEARRSALRALGEVAGGAVLLFSLVDDHVHVVLMAEPERIRRLQAGITRVFNFRASARFTPPFVREVESRNHLLTLVRYCLTQFEHHGLAESARTATGSCFPDLVGARRVPGLELGLRRALPRFQLREAYAAVGLAAELVPAPDAALRGLGARGLAEVVAATFGLGPGLEGNQPGPRLARRVVVQLASGAGIARAEVAAALGITPTAAARIAARPVPEADLRAVRLHAALRAAEGAPPARAPVRLAELAAAAP